MAQLKWDHEFHLDAAAPSIHNAGNPVQNCAMKY